MSFVWILNTVSEQMLNNNDIELFPRIKFPYHMNRIDSMTDLNGYILHR
jgi:hypothetical protein